VFDPQKPQITASWGIPQLMNTIFWGVSLLGVFFGDYFASNASLILIGQLPTTLKL
jgi:hypothetical protein